MKAGVLGQLWCKSVFGPPCKKCRDPVTQDPLTANCDQCYGVGKIPGYHGPYPVWFTFSVSQRTKGMAEDGTGGREDFPYDVRVIGFPVLKKDDILVDTQMDRRFYVNAVQHLLELRRVPVIQNITAKEISLGEYVYHLGEKK